MKLDSGEQDDPYVDSGAKGFRLITCDEWELAVRGRNDSTNTVDGHSDPWFTNGRSAGGATAHFNDADQLHTGYVGASHPFGEGDRIGFRIARTH